MQNILPQIAHIAIYHQVGGHSNPDLSGVSMNDTFRLNAS
jgi:hypothetical protein